MRRFVERVLALSIKEVRHVLRDPRTLYLGLGMPVVMLVLFGFGVSFDLDGIRVAFVDHDRSETSRSFQARMLAGRDFARVPSPRDEREAEQLLRAGEATMVVVVPRGFERDLRRGRGAELQLLIDGADNSTAVQARAKAETTLRVLASGSGEPPIEARTFLRFNPEGKSAVFLVPGIAAYVLAMVAVLLTALTVAREHERGSMAQLFATPVGRLEIILGKLLPYLVLGGLAVLLVLAFGAWVFDVPFRGDALALALLSILFLAGMLGQGLLISVLTKNQMVATQVAAKSSMLPSLMLSGFMFPIENMPVPLQAVSAVIPARYFVEGLRGVLLRGNGISEVWPELGALTLFAVVVVTIAAARFKRTIA